MENQPRWIILLLAENLQQKFRKLVIKQVTLQVKDKAHKIINKTLIYVIA